MTEKIYHNGTEEECRAWQGTCVLLREMEGIYGHTENRPL